jgi:hypothetical protein
MRNSNMAIYWKNYYNKYRQNVVIHNKTRRWNNYLTYKIWVSKIKFIFDEHDLGHLVQQFKCWESNTAHPPYTPCSTFKCWEFSTVKPVLEDVRDVALFHYPSCTDSMKPNLQFSCNYVSLLFLCFRGIIIVIGTC